MGKGPWVTHTELSLLAISTVAVAPFCPLRAFPSTSRWVCVLCLPCCSPLAFPTLAFDFSSPAALVAQCKGSRPGCVVCVLLGHSHACLYKIMTGKGCRCHRLHGLLSDPLQGKSADLCWSLECSHLVWSVRTLDKWSHRR